jgi:type II secretory pathway component PulC
MRYRAPLALGLLLVVGSFVACRGKEGDKAAEKEAAKAKATVSAVTSGAVAPSETPTEMPTATAMPSPTPIPTAPPEEKEGAADDLELIGIVRGGNAAGAVIALHGKQEIFRRGDSVFDHGTVKDVRDDSVIIHSRGKDVTLKVVREAPAAAPTEPSAAEIVEATPAVREGGPPAANQPLSRAEVRSALKDLADILGKADAKRVTVAGTRGVQLAKVEPESFLAKLGLRSGDVLQKLNGTVIDDPERTPDLSSAADGKELTIGFSRNDIGLTVSRPLQ